MHYPSMYDMSRLPRVFDSTSFYSLSQSHWHTRYYLSNTYRPLEYAVNTTFDLFCQGKQMLHLLKAKLSPPGVGNEVVTTTTIICNLFG